MSIVSQKSCFLTWVFEGIRHGVHTQNEIPSFSLHFPKELSYGYPWTSLYMDGTAVNFFFVICPHEAGTWDPNHTPWVDFLDHDFL